MKIGNHNLVAYKIFLSKKIHLHFSDTVYKRKNSFLNIFSIY